MDIPSVFCWTRFGTEAGQPIDKILERKEQERIANHGLFLWGIGNSLAPSISELVRRTECPEVLFSPTKTKARQEDSDPEAVVAWTRAETVWGSDFSLPPASLVTSGMNSAHKSTHYALVCFSERPLVAAPDVSLDFHSLRNMLTGQPVGASQVTAIVEHSPAADRAQFRPYDVALRARLISPFFVRLTRPVPIGELRHAQPEWTEVVQDLWAKILGRSHDKGGSAL